MISIESLYKLFESSTGISTDTRKIEKGNIFFALKGDNFNGNKFSKQALELGASICIVDEEIGNINDSCYMVENVLSSLQSLATYYRNKINIPVIAIAGSNGKTTTKELVGATLSTQYKTFATKGNLNNHIGVPLTLLSLKNDTQIAVIELGANHLNETALLCEIANPYYGVVTNNGKDHLEGYGSIEGVRKGNAELYDYMKKNKGIAFVSNLQKDLLEETKGMNRVLYGNESGDIVGKIISNTPFLKIEFEIEDKKYEVRTTLVGEYNFENIMCAIAIANYFKIDTDNIIAALEQYQPSNNRSQWIVKDGNNFIVDCYNANPSSMELAIENFSRTKSKNKIAVLGDMFELGKYSQEEHILMLKLLEEKKFDKIFLVGKEFIKANQTIHITEDLFADINELKDWFQKQKISDYTILLKGSRGMYLEKLLS